MEQYSRSETNLPSSTNETENSIESKRKLDRCIGKKVLAIANYQDSHPAVETAFLQAREEGYNFSEGDNPKERRIDAFLSTLENMPDSIRQEQLMDDMAKATDKMVNETYEFLQANLKEQLETWSDYFSDDNCDLPIWFKMWAWDGMSKLSANKNPETGLYYKRKKNTEQVVPMLNKGALDGVYNALSSYFSGKSQEDETLSNESLASCNFNVLYSCFTQRNYVPTPEYGEEIRGEWKEYKLGDENRVAHAADGTGWCVVSKTKARQYLEKENSSFRFFHLTNPTTGVPDTRACASIRTENGEVVEISGRKPNSGQMLEDSVVETVESEVLSMPGGEKYRKAFEDRRRLIEISHKDPNEVTKDDLEFIYEVGDNKIEKLEPHSQAGNRAAEIRKKYDINEALSRGVDKEALVDAIMNGSYDRGVNEDNIIEHLDQLLEIGVDPEEIMQKMGALSIYDHIDLFLKKETSKELILEHLGSDFIASNVGELISKGFTEEEVLNAADRRSIKKNVEEFLQSGIAPDKIMEKLWPVDIIENADLFGSYGLDIDINSIIESLTPYDKMESYDSIKQKIPEYDAYNIIKSLTPDQMWDSGHQNTVLTFLKRDDIDLVKASESVSQECLPYIQHFIVGRLEQEKDSLEFEDDEASLTRIAAINGALRKILR